MVSPTSRPSPRHLALILGEDDLARCMRCGFCLPACPTFRVTGSEYDSPRGRISIAKAVAEGLLSPDAPSPHGPSFAEAFDRCVGCLACQEACPAGVPYGRILEHARTVAASRRRPPVLMRWALRQLLPHRRRLRLAAGALRAYQRSRLSQALRRRGILARLGRLGEVEAMAPRVEEASPPRHSPPPLPEPAQARRAAQRWAQVDLRNVRARRYAPASPTPDGTRPPRVALLEGCVMDAVFPQVNRRTEELLAAAGLEVVRVAGQVCCGALHAHSGDLDQARKLARHNVEAFQNAGVDLVVTNAGGCGAHLLTYPDLLSHDGALKEESQNLASRVVDVSELLDRLGTLPLGPLPGSVTYQDSCHLRNGMGVFQAPRRLLQSIPGLTYEELEEAALCCGSGGIYNLTQPELSRRILDRKMERVRATQAQRVVTSNPGCQMQVAYGLSTSGQGERQAVHIVDVLWESWQAYLQAEGEKRGERPQGQ